MHTPPPDRAHAHLALRDSLATITLHNPRRHNAIDLPMAQDLCAIATRLGQLPEVGAVVLRGAGQQAFSAGMDLRHAEATGNRDAAIARIDAEVQTFLDHLQALQLPTIAMLHGHCYGAGAHLALAMQFRLCDTGVRWCIPAVRNRLMYPVDALVRLRQLIGPERTARMLLQGAVHDATELLQWGLVSQATPPDQLEAACTTLASTIAAQPRDVVLHYQRILQALDQGQPDTARALREQARQALRTTS